eukprot:156217-Pleurochrysis_carterae.AAC.1
MSTAAALSNCAIWVGLRDACQPARRCAGRTIRTTHAAFLHCLAHSMLRCADSGGARVLSCVPRVEKCHSSIYCGFLM